MCNPKPNRSPGMAESESAAMFACARRAAASARFAHLGLVARDRKNRQQPVAHEFQHLGAVLEDHRYLAIENSG